MRSLQGKTGRTVDAVVYSTITTRKVISPVTVSNKLSDCVQQAVQLCRSSVDLILCIHLPVTDHQSQPCCDVYQVAAVARCANTSLLLTLCANQSHSNQISLV